MITECSYDLTFANFNFDGGSFVTVFGILDCALLCLNTKSCLSFFYSPSKRSCSVSPTGYLVTQGLTPEVGVNYYSMLFGFGMQCTSTEDCSCHNCFCSLGSCQCAVGFSYQPSNGSCVMRCSKYGDDFSVYRHHGINSYNTKLIYLSTGTACMEACRDETSFVCINAEYKEGWSLCYLCDTAWFDIPENNRVTDDDGWVLYYRHCAN